MNPDRLDDDFEPGADRAAAAAAAASGVASAALAVLALAALLATSWRSVSRVRARRRSAPPRRLQTWENEGGRPPMAGPLPAEGVADAAV